MSKAARPRPVRPAEPPPEWFERIVRLEVMLQHALDGMERADKERSQMAEQVTELSNALLHGQGVAKGITYSGRAALAFAGLVGALIALLVEHILPVLRALIR